MRRGFFTFSATISLLLVAAAVVFWVRSYDLARAARNDHIAVRGLELYSFGGRLIISSRRKPTTSKTVVTTAADGSQIVTDYVQSYAPTHQLGISYVVIAITAAVLPIAWLVYFSRPARRRRLARAGRCSTCGYDLTGNTSRICPECGTPVPNDLTPPS